MQPQEIAAGVYRLEVGRGLMRSNVWFVHSGTRWALIDTGPPGCSQLISEAAKRLGIGDGALSAILLTHDHPDHAGSTHDLVEVWRSPVYVHPDELRFVKADATNFFAVYEPYSTSVADWTPPPLDRWIVLPLMRLSRRRHADMIARSSFAPASRSLEPDDSIADLPEWRSVATPGHTPGHVAYFRASDRTLVAGDSLATVDLNSPWGLSLWAAGRQRQRLSDAPWYFTWNRAVAQRSLRVLASLEPMVIAPGHGPPTSGVGLRAALLNIANGHDHPGVPSRGG